MSWSGGRAVRIGNPLARHYGGPPARKLRRFFERHLELRLDCVARLRPPPHLRKLGNLEDHFDTSRHHQSSECGADKPEHAQLSDTLSAAAGFWAGSDRCLACDTLALHAVMQREREADWCFEWVFRAPN